MAIAPADRSILDAQALLTTLLGSDRVPVQRGATLLARTTLATLQQFMQGNLQRVVAASGDTTGTTDTAAIQTALNSGQNVLLLPGIYYTNATLTVQSYTNCGQTLRGSGSYYNAASSGFSTTPPPGTTVIRPTAAVTTAMVIDGTPIGGVGLTWVQGFSVENLAIDMVNMADLASSVGIQQIQAWDVNYTRVRLMNGGINKSSWLFTTGAFTSQLNNCAGDLVQFTGAAFTNATTTITLTNCDIVNISHNFYVNVTFTGGAIQRGMSAAVPITYLAPGVTPIGYLPNTAGLYVAALSTISNSEGFTSIGTDWERGGGFAGTYNDGVHGVLNLVCVLMVASTALNTTLINPTFAGMYLLDYGINTRLIGQPQGSYTAGFDLTGGPQYSVADVITLGNLRGITSLANYLNTGITTTFTVNAVTGVATFQGLTVKPAADGASTAFQNAAGSVLATFNTVPGSVGLYVSGLVVGYQIKGQPATDGSNVMIGLNAAGTQLFNFTTNVVPTSSTFNFANGILTGWYSDNYVTLKASISAATGNIFTAGIVSVGANQVITARQTGWTAPIGTLSRAALNTGTATLANVAQVLGALITDLTTHGLIGA